MRPFKDEADEPSITEALRDLGWTLEPPRQVTPESLGERGVPSVFTPAQGIISVSRGNGDATLDLTPDQAREVAELLVIWADYNEDKETEHE